MFLFLIVIATTQSQSVVAKGIFASRIAPASQTITFPQVTTPQAFGVADVALNATASSGLTVTYTSSNLAVATIVAGKVHIVGIGNSTITASQPGDGVNYNAAPNVAQVITVNPVITFAAIGSKPYSTTDFAFTVATSNFPIATSPIVYTTSDATVATVVAGKLHFVGIGSCTITATQAAVGYSPNYVPASFGGTPTSAVTVTIGTAPVITFSPITTTLATADLTPTVTAASYATAQFPVTFTSDNPNVATIVNGRIHFTGVGTANLKASQAGVNPLGQTVFPTTTTANVLLTVSAPTLTFTTNMAGKTLTTPDFDPAATSTWTGNITYTVPLAADRAVVIPASNGQRLHIVGVSSTAASVTASLTYPTSPTTTAVVTASNATLTVVGSVPAITFAATKSVAYGTADFAGGATSAGSTVPILYTIDPSYAAVATVISNQIHVVGQGTAVIKASQGAGATATSTVPADVTQTLTVTAPLITFTAPGSKVFTSTDLAPGATSTLPVASFPINYTSSNPAVATIVNGLIHFVGVGQATITASQGGGVSGTATLPADQNTANNLTVTKAPATTITIPAFTNITATTPDFLANATSTIINLPITYSSSSAAVATIDANTGNIHIVGAGTTTITASQGNVVVSDQTATLTVAPIAPLITFAALGSKVFTNIDLAPGATSNVSSATITYTSDNTSVATIVNGSIHFVGLGSVNIKASQQGTDAVTVASATATLPADKISALTVTSPTLTLAAIAAKVGFVADFAPVPTTSITNVAVTYTSTDPEVATIVNGNVHITGAGTTQIVASQTAGANAIQYPAPADATASFSVSIQPAQITFPVIAAKQFGLADFAPGATSTSPLPVITYTSSDPTVATIANNLIHLVGPGTCVITASQAAAPGFIAPLNQVQTLTVLPAAITFVVSANPIPYNTTTDITLAATSTLSTTTFPITYTISDATIAQVNPNGLGGFLLHTLKPGQVIITASQLDATGNTAPAPVASVVVITPPTITFPIIGSKPLNNVNDYLLNATSPLASPGISYTSSNPAVATVIILTISGTTAPYVHMVNPGTAIITASQGGGATGTSLLPANVSQAITVTQPLITFAALGSKPFNATDFTIPATSTINATPTGSALQLTFTSSNTSVATILYPVVNGVVTPSIHYVGAGITLITATQGGGANGSATLPADVTQPLTVTASTLAISTALGAKPFTTTDLAIAATVTVPTQVTYTSSNPAVATISGTLAAPTIHYVGIGTTNITAFQAASGGYPALTSAPVVLTVGAPTLTFVATRSILFSGTDVDPAATSTLAVATYPITYTSSNPAVATIVAGKLHFTGNGITIITASESVPATAGFPSPASLSQTLTVTNGFLFPTTISVPYGSADFYPGGNANSSAGLPVFYTVPAPAVGVNPVATTVTNGAAASPGTQIHVVTPGSIVVTATQNGDANNPIATATTTVTVTASPLTITPKNLTRFYGQEMPIPYPVTYTGFTTVFGAGLPLDDSTKFTVQPTYASAAIVNGITSKTAPGTYTVTASGATSTFYSFTYGTGTFTILPAAEVLVFNPFAAAKHIGDLDFDPLARSGGDPLVYTSSNTNVATIVNGLVHIVGAGTTSITATMTQTSGNYVISGPSSLSQTLTVTSGAQVIYQVDNNAQPLNAPFVPALVKGNAAFTLDARSYSSVVLPGGIYQPTGLPVSIVSTDPSIVKVVGQTLQPVRIGTTSVTLKQPGNSLYNAATDVVVYVQVVDPTGNAVTVHKALSPDGDGINDFLVIEGIQDFASNHVKIITRSGEVVFDRDGYDNKTVVFDGRSKGGSLLPAGTYYYRVDYNAGENKANITGYFVLKY